MSAKAIPFGFSIILYLEGDPTSESEGSKKISVLAGIPETHRGMAHEPVNGVVN